MLKNTFKIIFLLSVITSSVYTQNKWIPLYNQESTAPTVSVSSSNNSNVSFLVQISGLNVLDKNVDKATYQSLYIPDAEVITEKGLPQVPVITKLIAIPDCEDVSLSITSSNELVFSDYNILPAPRFNKEKQQDGIYIMDQVFEEDKNIYSSNVDFPGKYGEIIETGYCRGQKVARVAIYPVQFNPVAKTIKVFDILGNEVAALVDEEKPAGEHKVEFDASKYNLSSGIYFCELKMKGGNSSRIKMVLIK